MTQWESFLIALLTVLIVVIITLIFSFVMQRIRDKRVLRNALNWYTFKNSKSGDE